MNTGITVLGSISPSPARNSAPLATPRRNPLLRGGASAAGSATSVMVRVSPSDVASGRRDKAAERGAAARREGSRDRRRIVRYFEDRGDPRNAADAPRSAAGEKKMR